MKTKYLIEYTWGINNPIHSEITLETENIDWSLKQFGRHRNNIKYIKVIKL